MKKNCNTVIPVEAISLYDYIKEGQDAIDCNIAKAHDQYMINFIKVLKKSQYIECIYPDVYIIPRYLAIFTKCLQHTLLGQVIDDDFKRYIQVVYHSAPFDILTLKGNLFFEGFLMSKDLSVIRKNIYDVAIPPQFCTNAMLYDTLELYGASIVRDLPFSKYPTDPIMAAIIAELAIYNSSLDYTNVFGKSKDYPVSQILFRDYVSNGAFVSSKVVYNPGADYYKNYANIIKLQNGFISEGEVVNNPPNLVYIFNLRTGSEYFKRGVEELAEDLYQKTLNWFPFKFATAIDDNYTEKINLKYLLNQAVYQVAKIVYEFKWGFLKLRPEALGIIIQNITDGKEDILGLAPELFNSTILKYSKDKFGNYLLTQAYSKGCDTCPTYPSLHCAVVAACATILKAYYYVDGDITLYEATDDGQNLVTINQTGTFQQELNKYISNVMMFRVAAGVSFRRDCEMGIELGENIAFDLLAIHLKTYKMPRTFELIKFNGTKYLFTNTVC